MKAIQTIENKIQDTLFGYQATEFFPVFEEGKLANRSAFIAYKLRKAADHAGTTIQGIVEYGQTVADNARAMDWRN